MCCYYTFDCYSLSHTSARTARRRRMIAVQLSTSAVALYRRAAYSVFVCACRCLLRSPINAGVISPHTSPQLTYTNVRAPSIPLLLTFIRQRGSGERGEAARLSTPRAPTLLLCHQLQLEQWSECVRVCGVRSWLLGVGTVPTLRGRGEERLNACSSVETDAVRQRHVIDCVVVIVLSP